MVTNILNCLTVRATLSYAMVMLQMASNCIAAARADGKAARIQLPTPIHKLAARRSYLLMKNGAVCAA
jgi:hypothetical protein